MSEREYLDVIASTEFEGGPPISDQAKDLVRKVLAGDITADEAVARMKEHLDPGSMGS